jgi:alkylhydroperoxidase family enzyme
VSTLPPWEDIIMTRNAWTRAVLRLSTGLLLLATWAAARADAPLKLLTNNEAWDRLPATHEGRRPTLPNWARATAHAMPRTTAAMLELDRLHRTKSPLGPALRGKMRWVAADANRCDYSRATAEGDLRRDGVGDDAIASLKAGPDRWPAADRAALEFASQMSIDASKVTDAEVEALRSAHGERKLTAMVLLLAWSNFQDRFLLSLGTKLEADGPLPAVEARFFRVEPFPAVPPRENPENLRGPAVPERVDDPEWAAVGFDSLQQSLSSQKANAGRVRVPTYEEVMTTYPSDYPKPKSPIRIKWTLVAMGYAPEMAAGWSRCMRAFDAEAKLDDVFGESLFWVVTRSIYCFY